MPTLFTIGYEQMKRPGDLVAKLGDAGVDMLIDVRDLPQSRKPGFSKSKLSELLGQAGIEYDHIKPLGNPKASRDLYKSGRVADGEAAFRVHLDDGAWAVRDISERVSAGWSVCLMCLEHEVQACHRLLVAEAIVVQVPGLRLVHL